MGRKDTATTDGLGRRSALSAGLGAGAPGVSAALIASLMLAGCLRSDTGSIARCSAAADRPEGVLLAGSGATIPLARALVAGYLETASMQVSPAGVVVAESIGTGGALRALDDGAIDVGMASRALDDGESAGIEVVPLATAELVIAASGREERTVDWRELVSLASGSTTTWRDGSPAVLVLRERGDSGNRVVASSAPELAAAFATARAASAGIVAYTDTEALALLDTVPGAFGLIDRAALDLADIEATPLRITGAPGGAPAWYRPLSFLVSSEVRPEVAAFIDFVRSEHGKAIVRGAGYADR